MPKSARARKRRATSRLASALDLGLASCSELRVFELTPLIAGETLDRHELQLAIGEPGLVRQVDLVVDDAAGRFQGSPQESSQRLEALTVEALPAEVAR